MSGGGIRDAEITIVGGGAVGCAIAYALARAGYPDIQVAERGELADATSGQAAGLEFPVVPVRHEYFVTQRAAGWHGALPVLRIPDIRIYARAEGPGILCGGWEADGLSLDPREVAVGQALTVQPDWDVLSGFARDFAAFVPAAAEAGVRAVFRGFPAFSPDGRFIVGPVPGIRGFVMAAACNAHGVSGSAGLAEHVLESLQPDPSPYVRSLSPARFVPRTWDWEAAREQAERRYEDYYRLGAAVPAPGFHP